MRADPLQVGLVDEPLIEEIQLLTDLIVAAAAATGPLDQQAIDAALNLAAGPLETQGHPAPPGPDAVAESATRWSRAVAE